MARLESLAVPAEHWSASDRFLRRRVHRQLADLEGGELTVRDALGEARFGTRDGRHDGRPRAAIDVHAPGFYRLLASGGSVGAGEAYMLGLWDCNDLHALIRLMVRNLGQVDGMEGGLARAGALLRRAWHAWNRNSLSGSRRNIAAHYDLGNDLFRSFLDEHMQYSCAVFDGPDNGPRDDLELAQRRKMALIGDTLALGPDDHLLEIGTGWGGLAVYLAQRHGCRVTTTTISRRQYEEAHARVAAAGLQDRVTLLLDDYRDLQGHYDKLVSVEMVEAVGHHYLDTYFDTCRRLLKPGGTMLLQAITIDDRRYQRALREADFIKRYIFPGSFIPSASVLTDSAARAGLRLTGLRDIGLDYARTLRAWDQRFTAARRDLEAMGYDARFQRMFRFYFNYCSGAFAERAISDVQMKLLATPAGTP
ncbi:MAG: cyclopropane-fatty-acyl-phospholipid synthase family protein [Xanthomonadales bacterium]|nr:cyclopropane-fatty-acyl-phospholipid synthase family protein [Xanthomonadales bacterium]